MQDDLQNTAKNKCDDPTEGFFTAVQQYVQIDKATVIPQTFHNSPTKLTIVIINIPIPILFCGINWHGPSCKNLAMPNDEDSCDSKSFI